MKLSKIIASVVVATTLIAPVAVQAKSRSIPGYGSGWESDGGDWLIRYSATNGSQSFYRTKGVTFFIQCGDAIKGAKRNVFRYEWNVNGKKGFFQGNYNGRRPDYKLTGKLPQMKIYGSNQWHDMPESIHDFEQWGNDAFTRITHIRTPEGAFEVFSPMHPVVCSYGNGD